MQSSFIFGGIIANAVEEGILLNGAAAAVGSGVMPTLIPGNQDSSLLGERLNAMVLMLVKIV